MDYYDTVLAAGYSHSGGSIQPIPVVTQYVSSSGKEPIRYIATGYEIQMSLINAICLYKNRIDQVAHLGSFAAGIGTLPSLDVEAIFQSVG